MEGKTWCGVCKTYVETIEEEAMGSVFCMKCCSVIEESGVVTNQLTFSEDNKPEGQFVSGSGRAHGLRGHTESRENTVRKAKGRIQKIAVQLKIDSTDKRVDLALNMYKYCLEKGLTRGRRSDLVAAACLYIICRREKTPHLLLDFSEVLKEDIFTASRTFFQLIRALEIEDIPLVEPWLYVERFASELEFGDKMNIVCKTAMKLIAQMKKDWIQTGRRPTSICAAALLIAGRIHGFHRTKQQIAKVMRICAGTLTKRLNELLNSNIGKMTVKEVDELPLRMDETSDKRSENVKPPCFIRKVKKEIKIKKEEIKEEDLNNFSIGAKELEELNEIANCETFKQMSIDLDIGDKHEKEILERVRAQNLKIPMLEINEDEDEIDEDEIDDYLLNDENEIKQKTKTWEILNSKYMVQFKKRQMEKEKKSKEKKKKKEKANKRKKRQKSAKRTSTDNFVANTAAESASRMLRKRMSQKKLGKIGLNFFSFQNQENESKDKRNENNKVQEIEIIKIPSQTNNEPPSVVQPIFNENLMGNSKNVSKENDVENFTINKDLNDLLNFEDDDDDILQPPKKKQKIR